MGTIEALRLRTPEEYGQVAALEDRLRNLVDEIPGWLYYASELGRIIDGLNAARWEYERERR